MVTSRKGCDTIDHQQEVSYTLEIGTIVDSMDEVTFQRDFDVSAFIIFQIIL